MRPMPALPRRARRTSAGASRRAAALLAAGALAVGLSACSGDDGVDPSTAEWPEAVEPAEAEGDLWVVWTGVADAGGEGALEEEVARLAELGYDAEVWDPACQEGAGEKIAGLTGIEAPVAVGLAFASEEDAGVFDTRYEGATVSLTTGAYTCA
ncbi:hypothetical protein [Cellulomonas shaoxiangyii]|uniref:Uncharacterized protein n=1 Tax=Cellulomonas shaoxiangyii TaxID=2566013 RepID=A0A4P7SFU6_9CELL|nr:hypothetical protein [Cellulomonas shaoxiangyii]QCB92872.1 hypothetical protein E5225_04195 [Cellulomonas shaoxiangyii]TGY78919.1 hypothetical protein E5226_15800 [Cellulomonas shaoxiangyii]